MQPNNPKIIKVPSCEKGDYERSRRRIRYRKAPTPYQVDFMKAEEVPESNLEKEVQKKIAVEPLALNQVMLHEEIQLLYEMIEKVKWLTDDERVCLKLSLSGAEPETIAGELRKPVGTVYSILARARKKVIRLARGLYSI